MTIDLTGGLSNDLEYVWTSAPDDPELRESVNAWVWDNGEEVGFPRIGVEAVADQWDTHDVQVNIALADGRVLTMFGPGPIHDPIGPDGSASVLGAGPLSFTLDKPFGQLTLKVAGRANVTTVHDQMKGTHLGAEGADLVPVELDLVLTPAVPPWVNGALVPLAKQVLDTQEEGDLMGHPWRFEQLCHATGTFVVEGRSYAIDGGANRIRRQSIRREAKLRGHAWQAALFPSGKGFSYIAYPERNDGKPTYNEGYVFYGDGELVPATVIDAPWLRSLVPTGEDVSLVLQTERGTVEIAGRSALATFHIMPPEIGGGLQLSQSIVHYTWDGEEANGMMERSTAPESVA
jgi:hypothetical protein